MLECNLTQGKMVDSLTLVAGLSKIVGKVGGSLTTSLSTTISNSVELSEKKKVQMELKQNQCLWVEFVNYGKRGQWKLRSSNWKACRGRDFCSY